MLFYNTQPTDSQQVPQLRDIPGLSPRVRLDFFNDVLKIDELSDIVDLFPNNLKIFICSVIFWLKTKENQVSKPRKHQLQSLVIMSLMDKIPCKVPESESSSNGSICQLCNKVCTKDCLVAKIKLRELFQVTEEFKDKYTKDEGYDKDTVHTFVEFEVIFLCATILNQLLQYPYPESNIMTFYNGPFLYWSDKVYKTLKKTQKGGKSIWMEKVEKASSFHSLVKVVDTIIERSEIGKSNSKKKSKKKGNSKKQGASNSGASNRFAALPPSDSD